MGFKKYLYWHDAVHGIAGYWINAYSNLFADCTVVTTLYLW